MRTLTEYLEDTSPQPGEAVKLTEEEFSDYKRGRWNGPKHNPEWDAKWVEISDPTNPNNKTWIEREYLIVDAASSSPGLKNDGTKSRVDLLDPDFLLAVGDALRFGAEKYKEHGGSSNWRRGIHISRLVASALRHLLAIMRGEDTDSDSGLPHTAHLGCCVQFIHWTLKHKPEFDDRFKY